MRFLLFLFVLSNFVGSTKAQQNSRWFEPKTLDTMLTFSDTVEITLKNTEPVAFDEYFIAPEILDTLIQSNANYYRRALAIEKHQMKTYGDIFKKDTKGLHLKLSNGAWIILTPYPKSDSESFTFEYFFRDHGYYSVRVQYSEGNRYDIVNYNTGKVTHLFGRPYFSPDGHYMISTSGDISAGYNWNGFQLFQNNNGHLELLGSYEPVRWAPDAGKWIDENKFVLKCRTTEMKEGLFYYVPFHAELKIN